MGELLSGIHDEGPAQSACFESRSRTAALIDRSKAFRPPRHSLSPRAFYKVSCSTSATDPQSNDGKQGRRAGAGFAHHRAAGPGKRSTNTRTAPHGAAFLSALLVILLVTWPFAAVRLPEVHAFVPTLAAALLVSDCVTAALLFAQFSILRQWALLVIASGYWFSALIVIAHALAFPGAFTPTGALGSGLQSAVWLYWFWHSGLPLAIIGYALLKDTGRVADVRLIRHAISLSVVAVVVLVVGFLWFVTQHQDLLPVTFTDVGRLSLFRRTIGGIVILALGSTALALLWSRQRSLLINGSLSLCARFCSRCSWRRS